MQRAFPFRRCLVALLSGLLLAGILGGCSSHITPDPGQVLAEQVKSSRNAYLRYAQAEDDARHDGRLEAAAKYHEAKEAALREYQQTDEKLTAYQASRPRLP